jgi:hypothetical protein
VFCETPANTFLLGHNRIYREIMFASNKVQKLVLCNFRDISDALEGICKQGPRNGQRVVKRMCY